MTVNLPRVGNRVEYFTIHADSSESWEPMGKVMGFGTSNGEPVALVELDEPFWAEGRQYFVTVLSVHLSSIRPALIGGWLDPEEANA